MHPTFRSTAAVMNTLDASVSRLQSATVEPANQISGVKELEEAMAAAPVTPRVDKRQRGPPTPQQPQAPASAWYVPGEEDLQRAMAEMPPVAVYPKRPRRDEAPSSNQAVCPVTPPAASSTTPRTIFKYTVSKPDAVAQQPHRAVTLGPATLAVPRQDQADSRTAQSHHVPPAASEAIPRPAW